MEGSNGLGGELFSNMGSGMLELEMSLHPHQPQPQSQQNPHHLQPHQHQLPIGAYGHHHEADQNQQAQRAVKQAYPYAPKSKSQLTLSDEDEPGLTPEDSAGDGSRKVSPWQRMKWTDSMVRLLIMVVFYIGDEAGSDGNDPGGKKKGGGLLQKKGKWKSVSRALLERGFYVSPQQCEDKFNDLNKRYKRVNDILGKGTACQVVENQTLLETMDHLTPKRREEVRKLLNSKHLFFREMCAYHNSCGGGGGGGGGSGVHRSPEVATEPSHIQQQLCFHSAGNAPNGPSLGRAEPDGLKMVKVGSGDEEDDDDDEDNDDDEEEEEDEVVEGRLRSHEHGHEEDDATERCSKRARSGVLLSTPSALVQKLSSDMTSVIQDGTKSLWEKRQWMKMRLMQLEEQKVGHQCEAFELEKQRLKWVKFSSKKEREMEREKLKNERVKLENERMVLLLRQKELELIDLQQQQQNCSHKRSDPSSING